MRLVRSDFNYEQKQNVRDKREYKSETTIVYIFVAKL